MQFVFSSIKSALTRLNNLYGKGDIQEINFDKETVTVHCPKAGNHTYHWSFRNKIVYFRGRQQAIMSESQRNRLEREYTSIYKKLEKSFSGGLTFGMDWPTLRVTHPEEAGRMQEIRHLLATR